MSLVSVFWIMYGNPTRYIVGSKYRSGYFPTFFDRLSKVFSSVVSLFSKLLWTYILVPAGLYFRQCKEENMLLGQWDFQRQRLLICQFEWQRVTARVAYTLAVIHNGNGSCLLQNTRLSSCISKNILSLSLSLSLYIYIYIYTHTHTHTHTHTGWATKE